MKHLLTSAIFDNDSGFIYCSDEYIEYYEINNENYSSFIDEVNCNQCLEKYNKFLQLKEKFGCKCFCHNLKYNEKHPIGHIGRFRVCCFNCPECDFKIDKNLEKEHEQYHVENVCIT